MNSSSQIQSISTIWTLLTQSLIQPYNFLDNETNHLKRVPDYLSPASNSGKLYAQSYQVHLDKALDNHFDKIFQPFQSTLIFVENKRNFVKLNNKKYQCTDSNKDLIIGPHKSVHHNAKGDNLINALNPTKVSFVPRHKSAKIGNFPLPFNYIIIASIFYGKKLRNSNLIHPSVLDILDTKNQKGIQTDTTKTTKHVVTEQWNIVFGTICFALSVVLRYKMASIVKLGLSDKFVNEILGITEPTTTHIPEQRLIVQLEIIFVFRQSIHTNQWTFRASISFISGHNKTLVQPAKYVSVFHCHRVGWKGMSFETMLAASFYLILLILNIINFRTHKIFEYHHPSNNSKKVTNILHDSWVTLHDQNRP